MKRKLKKIALINPRKNLQEQNPMIHKMFERNKNTIKQWHAHPLSLLIIAANTPHEIEVTLIDEYFEDIDFDLHFDLVGLTAMTHQVNRAYEIADIYRQKKIPVVMGGIHATVMPNEALNHVDSVFLGESELLWPEFLNDFEQGIEKRIYENSVRYDLASNKLPRYELLNQAAFKEDGSYLKFVPVQATRGCPHDCSFCVVSKFYGKKIRKRPVEQVVADIQFIQSLGLDSLIMFTDDNLFVDRKYVKELLKALIPLKIKYVAQSDVNMANDSELLQLAYLSGCMMVLVGFESLETSSLNNINDNNWKLKQVDNYRNVIKTIQSNGIVVLGAFVVGFENDNLDTFVDIRDFVLENHILGQFTILTPLPGSRVFEEFKNRGKLLNETFWDNCSLFHMNFRHNNIKKEEAESKIIWVFDEAYSETNVLNRNMHMMRNYKKLPPRWIL